METMIQEVNATESGAPDLGKLNETILGCEKRIECCQSELADLERADAENRADALLSGGKTPKASTRADSIRSQIAELNSTLTALRSRKSVVLHTLQETRLAEAERDAERVKADAATCQDHVALLKETLAEAERDLAEFPKQAKQAENLVQAQRLAVKSWPVEIMIGSVDEIEARADDVECNVDRLAVRKIVGDWKRGIALPRSEESTFIGLLYPTRCLIAFHAESGEILAAHTCELSPRLDGSAWKTTKGATWTILHEKVEALRATLKAQLAVKAE